ncbi:MAG: two-component system response regulator [Gammaproteobacteria bacterium]|nr:MAG: two-component system response regulator [Gammaproteobacteria bacterium]
MLDAMLVVDDDEVFLSTMSRSLSRRGETVLTANNLNDAFTILVAKKPARVLLDLNMDGDSGLQALPQMLKLVPTTQVIMLTGYASVATAVEAIKKGAVNYLCKPATATDVLAAFAKENEQAADANQANPAQTDDGMEPISIPLLEWEHIQRVLAENDGNISATARALGMHRRTLQRKLQKRSPYRRND